MRRKRRRSQGRERVVSEEPVRERSRGRAFPTDPEGKFARALSAIACNPIGGAEGQVDNKSKYSDTFSEQVSQALAVKLNLKTNQQANERALVQLIQSQTRSGGLKQALQARAAVYDKLLDPA